MTDRGKRTDYPGIYETKTGGYRVLVTAKIDGQKLFREKTITGSLHDALAAQVELRKELKKETEIKEAAGDETDTIEGFSKIWIAYLETTDTKPATLLNYKEHLKAHIIPYWKDRKLKDCKPKNVSDWLSWMGKTQGTTYAKKTLHQSWRVFCAFIRWACVRCNLPSPVEQIRFNAKGKEAKEKVSLTADELKRVLGKLTVVSNPYRSVIHLLATTGARIGEIAALRWSEVDLDGGIIKVCRSCTRGIITATTKTGQIRYVPMVDSVKAVLIDLKAEGYGSDGGLIFKCSNGGPIRPANLRRSLAKLGTAAELGKRITPHSFRRAANDLVRQQAGDVVARKLLGHMAPAMSLHYATLSHAEAKQALESVIPQIPKPEEKTEA